MRILITNDDGVFAPGLAALSRGLATAFAGDHELVVAAPLTNHSGASAAVGAVYEREAIPFESVDIPGLTGVPIYGIDGPPSLAVILACIDGFGPRPDFVVSGINEGMNAGRSVLHSGTVGATLTAAQFGVRGLAVSMAWSEEPVPWGTAVTLAVGMVPVLAASDELCVFNLNVPAVPLEQLKGVRHGAIAGIGLIRSVRPERTAEPVAGPAIDRTAGVITLNLRGQGDRSERRAEREELIPGSDAALMADGWASLTPIVGVREDTSTNASAVLESALAVSRQPRLSVTGAGAGAGE